MSARLAATTTVLGLAAAGCGGGTADAPAPVTAQQPAAAPVIADATAGELGPASRTSPKGTRVIGRRGPLVERRPRPGRPGGGVAGEGVCTDGETTGDLLCFLNAERAAAGLPGLRADGRLTDAAQAMAADMVEKQFFSHTGPDGSSVVDRIKPTGYLPTSGTWVVGENLAWGSGVLASARAIVAGWMNSPGHRANVLANDYRDIGLGVRAGAPVSGRDGGLTWVAEFGVRTPTASSARKGAAGDRSRAALPSAINTTAVAVATRGLRVPIRCKGRCSVRLRVYTTRAGARSAGLSARHAVVIGHATKRLRHGGRVILHVRLRARALTALRRHPPVRLVLSERISRHRPLRAVVRLR